MRGLLDELEKKSKETPKENTAEEPKTEPMTEETPKEEPKSEEKPAEATTEEPKTEEEPKNEEPDDAALVIAFGREQYPEEYGEGEFDDARVSALRKKILEDFKSMKTHLEEMTKNNKDLFKFVEDNPEFGEFLDKVKEGTSPELALLDIYGDEFLAAKDGSDERNAYIEAKNKRKADADEISKNLAESREALPKILEELGFPADRISEFEEFENKMWEGMEKGKFGKDYYGAMISAMDHDKNVETAREQGKVEGRNEQIEERLEKEEGDGIPASENGGGGKAPESEKKEEDEMTRTFRGMVERKKSIFDK